MLKTSPSGVGLPAASIPTVSVFFSVLVSISVSVKFSDVDLAAGVEVGENAMSLVAVAVVAQVVSRLVSISSERKR